MHRAYPPDGVAYLAVEPGGPAIGAARPASVAELQLTANVCSCRVTGTSRRFPRPFVRGRKRVPEGSQRCRRPEGDGSRARPGLHRRSRRGLALRRAERRRAGVRRHEGAAGPSDRGDEGLARGRASQRGPLGRGRDGRDGRRRVPDAGDGAGARRTARDGRRLPCRKALAHASGGDHERGRRRSGGGDRAAGRRRATSVKGLRDRCRQVRAGAEADDRAWARRLHEQRSAHDWTDPEGFYRLEARLAPDAGARFRSAWQTHIDRTFRDARRAGVREARVTVDSAALARGHTEPGERFEIDRVGPVPVTTARALLDDASVAVLVRDGDDITTVTSPTRVIPTKLRRALEARYPTCGVKTCANDLFLQIDHVVPLEAGGETNVHNTWRICSHHHFLKTYAGWTVVGEPGNWDLVSSDDPDPPAPPSSSNPSPVSRRTSSYPALALDAAGHRSK